MLCSGFISMYFRSQDPVPTAVACNIFSTKCSKFFREHNIFAIRGINILFQIEHFLMHVSVSLHVSGALRSCCGESLCPLLAHLDNTMVTQTSCKSFDPTHNTLRKAPGTSNIDRSDQSHRPWLEGDLAARLAEVGLVSGDPKTSSRTESSAPPLTLSRWKPIPRFQQWEVCGYTGSGPLFYRALARSNERWEIFQTELISVRAIRKAKVKTDNTSWRYEITVVSRKYFTSRIAAYKYIKGNPGDIRMK